MANGRILIVTSDPAIGNLLSLFLASNYHLSQWAPDAEQAIVLHSELLPDLIILDADSSSYNCAELRQTLRAIRDVPCLLLVSRGSRVSLTELGFLEADDYVEKSFGLNEILVRAEVILLRGSVIQPQETSIREPFDLNKFPARIKAILRRERIVQAQVTISYNGLTIIPNLHEVWYNNQLVELTALEFDILYYILSNRERLVTRDELISEVWDYEFVGDPRVVDVHIGQICKKLGIKSLTNHLDQAAVVKRTTLNVGSLSIDPVNETVVIENTVVNLPSKEFWILYTLANRPGKVFTRLELEMAVWEKRPQDKKLKDLWLVELHIQRLRQKIEPDPEQPRYIQVIKGEGFRFVSPEEVSDGCRTEDV